MHEFRDLEAANRYEAWLRSLDGWPMVPEAYEAGWNAAVAAIRELQDDQRYP